MASWRRQTIAMTTVLFIVIGILWDMSLHHSRSAFFDSKETSYSAIISTDGNVTFTVVPDPIPPIKNSSQQCKLATALRRRAMQCRRSNSSSLVRGFMDDDHDNHCLVFEDSTFKRFLSMNSVCALGPGQGMEEDAGYKLLLEKIRVVDQSDATASKRNGKSIASSCNDRSTPSTRLFCGIYSYSGKRDQVQVQAATWGYRCDGWIVFSNETVEEWGIYALPHTGPESYQNMWQKVRSIWAHVHQHFVDHFDYFYLGGDDTYVLVENLKVWLQMLPNDDCDDQTMMPRHVGQWLPGKAMVAGGPGYILNVAALRRLVQDALPTCLVNTTASFEDRLMSKCLSQLGIWGNQTDTRDFETGEQRFHDASPTMLYTFRTSTGRRSSYLARTAMTWEDLPHPSRPEERVGRKHGLEAAATYSFSFHNIYNPYYLARIHAIIHPTTCPEDSSLGRGLRQHLPPEFFIHKK